MRCAFKFIVTLIELSVRNKLTHTHTQLYTEQDGRPNGFPTSRHYILCIVFVFAYVVAAPEKWKKRVFGRSNARRPASCVFFSLSLYALLLSCLNWPTATTTYFPYWPFHFLLGLLTSPSSYASSIYIILNERVVVELTIFCPCVECPYILLLLLVAERFSG